MSTNVPSLADRAKFELYLHLWRDLLNLNDWRLYLREGKSEDTMAEVEIRLGDRLALFTLGDFGDEAVTDDSLMSTAIHELLHVMLEELIEFARDPNTTEEHLASLTHRVINVIEPLLLTLTTKG